MLDWRLYLGVSGSVPGAVAEDHRMKLLFHEVSVSSARCGTGGECSRLSPPHIRHSALHLPTICNQGLPLGTCFFSRLFLFCFDLIPRSRLDQRNPIPNFLSGGGF